MISVSYLFEQDSIFDIPVGSSFDPTKAVLTASAIGGGGLLGYLLSKKSEKRKNKLSNSKK